MALPKNYPTKALAFALFIVLGIGMISAALTGILGYRKKIRRLYLEDTNLLIAGLFATFPWLFWSCYYLKTLEKGTYNNARRSFYLLIVAALTSNIILIFGIHHVEAKQAYFIDMPSMLWIIPAATVASSTVITAIGLWFIHEEIKFIRHGSNCENEAQNLQLECT